MILLRDRDGCALNSRETAANLKLREHEFEDHAMQCEVCGACMKCFGAEPCSRLIGDTFHRVLDFPWNPWVVNRIGLRFCYGPKGGAEAPYSPYPRVRS